MFGTIEIRRRHLRLPLAVCTAAALVGGAAAAAAWWRESRVAEQMNAVEARLAEARGRHLALAEEQRTRRRFGPLYRRLAADGRIGEEQRERWTEAVRSAAAATVLAASPRVGAPHLVQRTGPVEVRAADMSIDLEMRHEADLPVFLAALDREKPGLFTVSGCRLLRTDGTSAPFASVGASCRIRWQSVVLTGVEPGWTPAAEAERGAGRGGGGGTDGEDHAEDEPRGWRPDLADPPRETFGRLFTTVAQRAEIESAMAARLAAKEAAGIPEETPTRPEPPPQSARWIRVGGVVARSGRSVYAWVGDRRVAVDGSHPEGATPAAAETPGVRLGAGGRSIVVRPGQRFDPRTGAVIDPVHRPAGRFERGRFLHESSRAPLTDPPVVEQN